MSRNPSRIMLSINGISNIVQNAKPDQKVSVKNKLIATVIGIFGKSLISIFNEITKTVETPKPVKNQPAKLDNGTP